MIHHCQPGARARLIQLTTASSLHAASSSNGARDELTVVWLA